jgi:hypothetical protein
MANPGYDEVYAASRVADIDAQIDARNAEVAALIEQRDQYAPSKPKRTRAKAED